MCQMGVCLTAVILVFLSLCMELSSFAFKQHLTFLVSIGDRDMVIQGQRNLELFLKVIANIF